jgi:hypothetical protein
VTNRQATLPDRAFVRLQYEPELFASSLLLQAVAVFVSAIYAGLSLACFFSKPVVGSTIGVIGFLVAAALAHA